MRGRNRLRRGALLPIVVILMVAVASAAVVKLVIRPEGNVLPRIDTTLLGSVFSRSSSGSSSSSSSGTPVFSDSGSSVPDSSSVPQSSSPPSASSAVSARDKNSFEDAAFIGDSLTMGIADYAVTKTSVFASYGMSVSSGIRAKISTGETLQKALESKKPDRIYLMLGLNNVTWMSVDTFAADYRSLIGEISKTVPGAKIYIQSILPVTASCEKKQGISNNKITSFNAALKSLCAKQNLVYLDISAALTDGSGVLPSALSTDGMNIRPSAYSDWIGYLIINQ